MKPLTRICFFFISFLLTGYSYGQMRHIYTDPKENNQVRNFSFYSAKSGYVAFDDWIGFTQDSGRTFTRKYIDFNNVDYNNQFPNLTFGFTINGVHAFSQDTLIVYGNYGFAPSILYSSDGGTTFLLTYYQPYDQNFWYDGVFDVSFPTHSTGYAVMEDRVLKTLNKGRSWSTVYSRSNKDLRSLQFLDDNTGFVYGGQPLKTTNGGLSWQPFETPNGITGTTAYFLNTRVGWCSGQGGTLFQTLDGGQNWIQKNDPEFYQVGFPLHFVNDSVGYSLGGFFDVWKTIDSGKTWEPLERDNNFEYLGYGHNNFFFWDENTFWAGGGHGFIELTTNGGGTTLPKAQFTTDLTQLSSNHKLIFNNKTKSGYSYKWTKNSVMFSTDYNAEYTTDRLSIDTVRLIVQKGNYRDTAETIIDTRDHPQFCNSDFQISVDTATVRISGADSTTYGLKHYWDFGDGSVDSTHANPLHAYTAIGIYALKHVVYNPIDRCSDTMLRTVTIIRTNNCLAVHFTYTPDTFFTNHLRFDSDFDHTKESGSINALLLIATDWGDGTTDRSLNPHIYDSAKYYNVCFTYKNIYTGCINTVCQQVQVKINTACDANFLISQADGTPRSVAFTGKPTYAKGKRNEWIINNGAKVSTGNSLNFQTSFFKEASGAYFNSGSSGCSDYAYEICIDSLNKTIKHVIYDSTSLCSDTVVKSFTVARAMGIFIKAVADPAFPQYVSFYAYQLSGQGDTVWYNTIWHIEGPDVNTYQGGYATTAYKMTYAFPHPGDYKIYVAANRCINDRRELYYINYHVNTDGCGVYTSDFSYDQNGSNLILFYTSNGNPSSNTGIWDWGDSTSNYVNIFSHIYYVGGIYNVSLKYISPSGCEKQTTKPVFVEISCKGNRIWLDSRLPSPPQGIDHYQWEVNNGTGWTNVPNTGVYFYPDGAFVAGPNLKTLSITGADASYNGYQYRCYNGSQYKYFTIRFTNKWLGTVSNEWGNPANWSCGFVPDLNTTVVIPSGTVYSPVISSNATIYNLVVNSGATVTVSTGYTLTVLH